MRSRAYNKRFKLYETTTIADGYGGYTTESTLLANSWCKISTLRIGDKNSTDLGLLDPNNSLIITTRKRNDITYNSETQYIVYRGDKYIINTMPINVDFEDREIKFIVVKASSVDTNELGGVNDLNSDLVTDI